jgi:uncharacterized protein (DUF305 family)
MNSQRQLSNVATNYLCRYYEILNDMVCGMTDATLTDSISNNFIAQMIPHHRAAIEMARNILQYTTCIPVQCIAANIVEKQTRSIERMTAIRTRCSELENTEQELCLYQQRFRQITQPMFQNMRNACFSNQINANFLREMIPHHKGAICMSENALQYPICPDLVPILRSIILSQRAGVRKMECMLRCM